MKLAKVSIKRPSLIIVLFIILTLGGVFAYSQLGYELVPDFDVNVITVQTVYPGAAPSEVENSVTKKIEDAVASLENVKKIESKSMESASVVMITLTNNADVDYSVNDAQRKVNAVLNDLPEDAERPTIVKFSLDDVPIINLSVTSEKLSSKELYQLLDQKIQPVFSRLQGVAKVEMVGGQEREIQVNVVPEKLKAYGLTISQVQQIISASNMEFPTGNIETRDSKITIRLSGKLETLSELRNLPIQTASGKMIRLSDIAYVEDGTKDVEKISRINQKSTILLQVYKQSDANAVSVSERVTNTIDKVEKDYAIQGLNIIVASDSSDYTLNAADNVMHDLFLAIILVAIIMLFFLHSLRNAAITLVAIPLSLIATFIGMYALGFTLNLMSLLGLSLVVGILVDDAIVVIENIHRHMEMGKNKVRAAYDGVKEIGFTVMGITLVIIVVFLPISLATGLVPDILRQFTVTVMIATAMSLLVSFSIAP
ncbi:MAG TPA: efflux RND transporter permease subunit, partial [Chitinophagaceae bacterium]|nr:efflux RND transporter permease subunit [Chitinophagaceae bacterium]